MALAGVATVLAALAWGILLFQILPRIDAWRFDLSEQATRALGVTVRIGHVLGHADGIWPMLTLQEVQLLDERGRVALRLPQVTARISMATLSPKAMWSGEVRLDMLELVRPELDIRRDPTGVIHVAGLRLPAASSSGSDGSAGLDWLMSQPRISISKGALRWTDERLGAPTLSLQDVDLALRNRPGLGRRKHELLLTATPPAEFGKRFEVTADLAQPLWLAGGSVVRDGEPVPWWQRWQVDVTRPGQWQTWSGPIRISLPHVDVQQLKRHVVLPVNVDGGRGAVTAEVLLKKGVPSGLTLQAAVADVRVRLDAALQPLAFRRLDGDMTLDLAAGVSTLTFKKLAFELDEGLIWPASSASLSWRHTASQPGQLFANWASLQGGQLQADRLDLALLASLADRLPLGDAVRASLAELTPKGVVSGLSLSWDGQINAPTHFKVTAQVAGLGLSDATDASAPGLAQADVKLTATESGGQADVQMKDGWVTLPGVFEEPRIPLSTLKAAVNWSVKKAPAGGASVWQVDVTQASFANDDAAGQLQGSWRTGAGEVGVDGQAIGRLPGWLKLTGRLDRAQATRVWRYLPLSLSAAPREYVRQALRSGRGENVSFEVDGALDHFPFKDDVGGRFRIKVPLKDVALDYVPPALQGLPAGSKSGYWPGFTALEGLLLFEGQRMVIQDAKGRIGGVGSGQFALKQVEGRIDDLGSHDPHLTIKGQGDGPLNDLMRFLAISPISAWTGHALDQSQATGTGALQLSLDIPLDRADDTKLKGLVTLLDKDQASLRLNPSVPQFAALRGTISLTESLLNVQAHTRVWGHEVSVDGGRTADGAVRFAAKGNMSAEGLRQARELPFVARLAQSLSGEAPVAVAVTIGGKGRSGAEVQINSTLQGISSNLPAPLNKSAQSVWPLTVVHRDEGDAGRHDALMVDLGNPQAAQMTSTAMPWLRVDLRRDISGDTARVQRGLISLIQAGLGGASGVPALPSKGVAAQAVVSSLDLEAWQNVAKGLKGPDDPKSAAATGVDASETYLPDSVSLKAGAVSYQQRTLKDVSATLAHPAAGVWRLQLDAQQAAGQVEWVPETAPLATGPHSSRVVARLSRLSVPNADAQSLQEQAAEQMLSADASTLPALDIVIEQFEWRGLPLGRIEIEALNRLVPVVGGAPLPEWRLTKLRLSTPDAQLNASGNWAALGAQSATRRAGSVAKPRAAFGFTLDLQNSGALLTRLGLPQTLKGGKGKIAGQVSWLGSPLEPDTDTMSGDINVQISEGQFLKVDPGMAKLLGVLSLQSLPRRLTLDFRDLFQQGFAFDSIDGDVKVAQGVATTRNLRMKGVQAVVLMEGQADLSHETQNLHVFVVPQVNAEAASLAYAAINPVIGLGTFIAQVLLRKQVADVGTQEFKITGPWSDPQVEKVGDVTKPRKPS